MKFELLPGQIRFEAENYADKLYLLDFCQKAPSEVLKFLSLIVSFKNRELKPTWKIVLTKAMMKRTQAKYICTLAIRTTDS